MIAPPFTLDWRSSSFSDWHCSLGNRSYALHKVVLAEGSRSSQFFRAAFHEQYEAASTNLTALLPEPCHEHLENVFDFMYGHDICLEGDIALHVLKIADVLQIDSLLAAAKTAVDEIYIKGESSLQTWKFACQLGLPAEVEEGIRQCVFNTVNPSEILLALVEEGARPERTELFKECAEHMKRIEDSKEFFDALHARSVGHPVAMIHPMTLRWIGPGGLSMFPLGIAKMDIRVISSCRIRVVKWSTCYASAVGVASEHADLSGFNTDCHKSGSGGFTRLQHCWGLSYHEKKLFSEGRESPLSATAPSASAEWLLGHVLRLELNKHAGSLCFFREDSTGDVDLGTITVPFKEQGKLFFTASACCIGCEFELLEFDVKKSQ